MTISDPRRPDARLAAVAVVLAAAGAAATLAACGQKGALRLPEAARAAASAPTVLPGVSSRAPDAPRDPFSNPSPTELPASVPRP